MQDVSISVRRATPADAAALADLVNAAFAVEAFFAEGDRTTVAELERLMRTGMFLVLDRFSAPPFGGAAHPGEAGACDRFSAPPFGGAAHPGEAGACDRFSAPPFGGAAHPGEAGACDRFSAPPFGGGGLAAAVYVEPRAGHFGMLSVAPDLQGRGLGKRLVRIAEGMSEAAGCVTMSLQVVNLRDELARWYRSLGYRETGVAPFNHRGLKQPAHFVEMQRELATVWNTVAS